MLIPELMLMPEPMEVIELFADTSVLEAWEGIGVFSDS